MEIVLSILAILSVAAIISNFREKVNPNYKSKMDDTRKAIEAKKNPVKVNYINYDPNDYAYDADRRKKAKLARKNDHITFKPQNVQLTYCIENLELSRSFNDFLKLANEMSDSLILEIEHIEALYTLVEAKISDKSEYIRWQDEYYDWFDIAH